MKQAGLFSKIQPEYLDIKILGINIPLWQLDPTFD